MVVTYQAQKSPTSNFQHYGDSQNSVPTSPCSQKTVWCRGQSMGMLGASSVTNTHYDKGGSRNSERLRLPLFHIPGMCSTLKLKCKVNYKKNPQISPSHITGFEIVLQMP